MRMDADTLIRSLGGVTKVARLCEITAPSVDGWRKHGIPKARVLYFRALAKTRRDVREAVAEAERCRKTA